MRMNEEHGIEGVLWDNIADGWRIICECGWRSPADHLMSFVGQQFDVHVLDEKEKKSAGSEPADAKGIASLQTQEDSGDFTMTHRLAHLLGRWQGDVIVATVGGVIHAGFQCRQCKTIEGFHAI